MELSCDNFHDVVHVMRSVRRLWTALRELDTLEKTIASDLHMTTNFHENYGSGEVEPPSERSTGLVFAGVALIVAFLNRHSHTAPWIALAISVALAAISLGVPRLLKPLNIFWFRLGLLLHRIVNPLVMFMLFAVVFVPGGLLMRLWANPLRARRAAQTYWIKRESSGASQSSMVNQY